jgi:agmatine deiminase
MCWPARASLYGELMTEARAGHAEVARTVARFEPVTMIAAPGHAESAAAACGTGVDVVELAIDDAWFRDTGPIYVVDDDAVDDGARRVALDFVFNSWGGKFLPYDDDVTIARRWAEHAGHPSRSIPVVLEGGSIAVDGDGTLVTTEQCLLHPNRNPTLTRTAIDSVLCDELGVSVIVWLPHGLALDDDTDGHVDNVAAFTKPGTLLMQGCDDEREPDWLRCHVNIRSARDTPDAGGRRLDVVDVPVLAFAEIAERRVAVPYLNYYVVNGGVVVPVTGHDADDDMLAIIADHHPGRAVVGLDVGAVLAYGGGGVHCITQQIPALHHGFGPQDGRPDDHSADQGLHDTSP